MNAPLAQTPLALALEEALPAHSKLGASSSKRWMTCPGSVRLSAGLHGSSSAAAEEGTRAHGFAEGLLRHSFWMYIPGGVKPLAPFVWEDEQGEASEDMVDAVTDYANEVGKFLEPGCVLLVEHKFHLKKLHAALFGTADCVIWNPHTRTLYVGDYKHGVGTPVEAEGNTQLQYYGLGTVLTTEWKPVKCVMFIVQPRCPHPAGPVRSWEVPAASMIDYSSDLLAAVARTEDPLAPLVAGDHCKYCPAAGLPCPLLKAEAERLAKLDFVDASKVDPKALSDALYWSPIMANWLKSLKAFAFGQIEHGNPIPGWKLVAKRASKKWITPSAVSAALAENFGLGHNDVYADPKLRSPAQIEKLLSPTQKKLFREAGIYSQESTGPTLVHESDKREAIAFSAAADFDGVEVDE